MEKNNLRSAASDFFPFGKIRSKLLGTEFWEKHDLLAEIREILNRSSGKVLKAGLLEWKSGCRPALTPEVRTWSKSSFLP
jgi:hypothetical protein